MKSFARSSLTFTHKVVSDLMQPCLYSPGDCIFQRGVVYNSVLLFGAGAALYVPWTHMFANFMNVLRSASPALASNRYEHYRSVNVRRVEKVGTSICECALFVSWVTLGDMEVDAHGPLSLLALDTQEFQDAVSAFPELQHLFADHAQRVIHIVSTKCDFTDLLCSDSILEAM